MSVPMRVHASTHEGLVHDTNEDSHATLHTLDGGLLLVVCDGMGGMGHGDEASRLAIDVLSSRLREGAGPPPERMREAIRQADIEVREALCDDGRGMPGTTAVLVYVVDGMGHVAWVGDSRAYLVRGGTAIERTRDHKLVSELVAAGQLTEEEARTSTLAHVVTRALGGRGPRERPVTGSTLGHPWKFNRNDVVVLCSDGVCDLVTDDEIGELVRDRDPAEAVRSLIQLALERGGHDNITCIVARWEGPDFVEELAPAPLVLPTPAGGSPVAEEIDEPSTEALSTYDDDAPALTTRRGLRVAAAVGLVIALSVLAAVVF